MGTGVAEKGSNNPPQAEGGDRKSHRLAEPTNIGGVSGAEGRTAGGAEAGGGGGGGGGRGATTTAESSPRQAGASSGGPARPVASSSKKELDQHQQQQQNAKEPAHAWEHGPSNPKAKQTSGGVKSGGGGNSSAPTTDNTNTNNRSGTTGNPEGMGGSSGENRSSKDESGGGGDEGCDDEGLSGGALSGVETHASQEASRRFVRDSIEAAVVKARECSVEDERDTSVAVAAPTAAIGSTPTGTGEESAMGVAPVTTDVACDLRATEVGVE